MNFKIRKLEDDIIALLNESDVAIEAKRLIIKDICGLVSAEADRQILEEINHAENISEDQLAELPE